MREIKFRAWDKKRKELQKPFLIEEIDNDMWWKDTELMQYTGLKDKTGKEIYEDDIVEKGDVIGIAEWVVNGYTTLHFALRNEGRTPIDEAHILKEIEVIGNIYENKDLL